MPPSSRADVGTPLDRRRRALAHASLVTGLTTVATGCAHSLAGGAAPPPLLLAAAFMVTLAVLGPVLGSRSTWPRRIVAVALAQIVQHGLYALPQPTSVGGTPRGHAHHGLEAIATPAAGVPAHAHGDMLLAHVLAGALTLVAVAVGAAVVRVVLAALRGDRLVELLAIAVPLGVARPASVAAERPAARPASTVARTPVARRGPPLALV